MDFRKIHSSPSALDQCSDTEGIGDKEDLEDTGYIRGVEPKGT